MPMIRAERQSVGLYDKHCVPLAADDSLYADGEAVETLAQL
jgi:hypothetical protein